MAFMIHVGTIHKQRHVCPFITTVCVALQACLSIYNHGVCNIAGMFHIALTTAVGKNGDPGWYEIGVYGNAFFVRPVDSTLQPRTLKMTFAASLSKTSVLVVS